ncbi:hypothetical protein [Microbacterium sp.]|uniref:hypothetical protein n=1 Tax=Microbacterium sp. TaxID=51671 RepID=UPI0028ADF0D1|nr:hypothetical protein [Microbacterium sp.]
MIDLPDTASVATCTAIAQILPVFLVALVAERIVRAKQPKGPMARARSTLALLIRILVDLAIASGLLAFTFVALMGIEANGLSGPSAEKLWGATFVLGFAILYRWMLLSTPLLGVVNEVGRASSSAIFDTVAGLSEGASAGLAGVWTALYSGLYFVSEAIFSILGGGLYEGAVRTAEKMVSRIAAKQDSDSSAVDEARKLG